MRMLPSVFTSITSSPGVSGLASKSSLYVMQAEVEALMNERERIRETETETENARMIVLLHTID